jgi:hypothetical protein
MQIYRAQPRRGGSACVFGANCVAVRRFMRIARICYRRQPGWVMIRENVPGRGVSLRCAGRFTPGAL